MKYCERCKVRVTGQRGTCPLCQGELSGNAEGSEDVFPLVPTFYHRFSMLFKVLLFASVLAVVAAVAVNLLFPDSGWWSLFVLAGVGCVWLSLALGIRKRKNIPKGMLYQVVWVSVACVLWDLLFGWRGWSIDYVIPILCVSVMVALAVLARILNWKFENILIYFCIDALFGIVPILFFFTGILHVPYPSIICVACSVASIAAIIIFKGDSIWAELKRRLYI